MLILQFLNSTSLALSLFCLAAPGLCVCVRARASACLALPLHCITAQSPGSLNALTIPCEHTWPTGAPSWTPITFGSILPGLWLCIAKFPGHFWAHDHWMLYFVLLIPKYILNPKYTWGRPDKDVYPDVHCLALQRAFPKTYSVHWLEFLSGSQFLQRLHFSLFQFCDQSPFLLQRKQPLFALILLSVHFSNTIRE